jgi:methylated-DNA-protein-cysteine methyltransferase-like protein
MSKSDLYPRIYQTVRRIPRGRVATYGQIAGLSGIPGHARQVGYALHRLQEGSGVPWHRVVNRLGRIALVSDPAAGALQRALLESEDVAFDSAGTVSLSKYRWKRR